jgi:hypothetical protein
MGMAMNQESVLLNTAASLSKKAGAISQENYLDYIAHIPAVTIDKNSIDFEATKNRISISFSIQHDNETEEFVTWGMRKIAAKKSNQNGLATE